MMERAYPFFRDTLHLSRETTLSEVYNIGTPRAHFVRFTGVNHYDRFTRKCPLGTLREVTTAHRTITLYIGQLQLETRFLFRSL